MAETGTPPPPVLNPVDIEAKKLADKVKDLDTQTKALKLAFTFMLLVIIFFVWTVAIGGIGYTGFTSRSNFLNVNAPTSSVNAAAFGASPLVSKQNFLNVNAPTSSVNAAAFGASPLVSKQNFLNVNAPTSSVNAAAFGASPLVSKQNFVNVPILQHGVDANSPESRLPVNSGPVGAGFTSSPDEPFLAGGAEYDPNPYANVFYDEIDN